MKRILLIVGLQAVASICWGQTLGDQINDLTKQLHDAEGQQSGNAAKIKKQADDMDNIKFAANAYKTQQDRLNHEIDDLNIKIKYHNDHQCTEKCVNGKCDGSCQRYQDEAARENAEAGQLQGQQNQLNQIRDKVSQDTTAWVQEAKDLLAENDRLDAAIANLRARLADLRGQYDKCRGSIPINCDAPDAVDKDYRPLPKGACEKMRAKCGTVLDGN